MISHGIEFSAGVSNTLRISLDVSGRHVNAGLINHDFKVVVNRWFSYRSVDYPLSMKSRSTATRKALHIIEVMPFLRLKPDKVDLTINLPTGRQAPSIQATNQSL
jgi:hypothetical protein